MKVAFPRLQISKMSEGAFPQTTITAQIARPVLASLPTPTPPPPSQKYLATALLTQQNLARNRTVAPSSKVVLVEEYWSEMIIITNQVLPISLYHQKHFPTSSHKLRYKVRTEKGKISLFIIQYRL